VVISKRYIYMLSKAIDYKVIIKLMENLKNSRE